MECFATIVGDASKGTETKTFAISPLEMARIVAADAGFYDLDLEPEVGVLRLTVTGNGMSIVVRGRTTAELAEKLMEKLS